MANLQDQEDALTYIDSSVPDINLLETAYRETVTDLEPYFRQCLESYDERRNYWPGKTTDLRKNGKNAFPWQGASDTEAHVISSRINKYVAKFLNALRRSNIRAYPVEASDGPRAKMMSSFLKWMVSCYIPRFCHEMELAANYGMERGIMVTYVGWQKKRRKFLQKFDIEEINKQNPELAQSILEGAADDTLYGLISASFPNAKESRIRKAIKQLKTTGVTELPVSIEDIQHPDVQTLSPDGEFLLPAWTMDPQRVPYCFWRTFMTAQEIESAVESQGWDRTWATHVISALRGQTNTRVGQVNQAGLNSRSYRGDVRNNDLYEIVYCYQRLIDRDDGAEGIYCTIFAPEYTGGAMGVQPYAKSELLNGYKDYPFIVTRIHSDTKQIYDVQTFPEMLRGFQQVIKAERDSRIDRNSFSTVPSTFGPPGVPVPIMRPGHHNIENRPNTVRWADQPPFNAMSVEIEKTMTEQADELMGLNPESPYSTEIQQFYIEKFLSHVRDVLKSCFKAFQRFGPDEVFFRVNGSPNPITFGRGDPNEEFDLMVNFDSLSFDTDTMEVRTNQIQTIIGMDRNGRINVDLFMEYMLASIDPVLADTIIMPAEAAQQQVVKQVTDDLTKIYSGIELNARPNGAQISTQVIQTYMAQPDVQARYGADEAFRKRLDNYLAGYTFQMQQSQNAVIGRIGAAPAAFGDAPQGETQV
jgi:hypothetical protein